MPFQYIVDLPLIPPLERGALTSIAIGIILFIKKQRNPIFKSGTWNKLLIGYLLVIMVSTLLNFEPYFAGGMYFQGTSFYDVLVNPIIFLLTFFPFFLGRNFFNAHQDTEYLFRILGLIALIYSIPMLWELQFSPQLHTKVFGYFPGDFIQQIRGDGYRPVVLVGHGLALAFLFSTCIVGVFALYKAKVKPFGLLSVLYLIIILILCKTVSAVFYVAFAFVLLFFLESKKQLLFSFAIAALVMVYPFNATSQFIKNEDMINYVKEYSADRAQSIETRFTNEDRLVDKALEKPFFGWSGWGRNRVYMNGKDITITDGKWIIILGLHGILGFIFYYLLLLYPIRAALKYYKYIEDEKHRMYFVSLAIILALGIVDSVPNTGMMPIHLLLAGALLGQCEAIRKKQRQLHRERIEQS